MDNLITDALQWKFGADIAVSNGFRFCPPLVPDGDRAAAISNDYLWSMLPVDSIIKSGVVTGGQIVDWLEAEPEHTFSKHAAQRVGGWLVRFKGLTVAVTIGNRTGSRAGYIVKDDADGMRRRAALCLPLTFTETYRDQYDAFIAIVPCVGSDLHLEVAVNSQP